MGRSPEQRIKELEAELNLATAEIKKLKAELAAARLAANNAKSARDFDRNETNKRMLEERKRRQASSNSMD